MSTIETRPARDGTPLLTRASPTTGEPWGTVLVVHGLGWHSGRHDATGGRFAAAGLVATSFDHRGFGASGGRRAALGEAEPQGFSDLAHGSTGTGHRHLSWNVDAFQASVPGPGRPGQGPGRGPLGGRAVFAPSAARPHL